MHRAVGGEDGRLARSECQSDQALAGDFKICFALRSDLYDAAFAAERRSNVNIAFNVERQALRTPKAAVKH